MKKSNLRPRRLSAGGGFPMTPEQQELLRRQQQQQGISQQIGQAVPQVMGLFGGGAGAAAGAAGAGAAGAAGAGAAGAATGAAGAAGAAGPVGLAIAGGMAVNGLVKSATTDADGFAKTNTGSLIARSLGDTVDPIGRIVSGVSNLGRKDLSAGEKALSFLPGIGAMATDRADQVIKQRLVRKRQQNAVNASEAAIYSGGVPMAARGIRLLPHKLAGGGKPPLKKRAPAPATPQELEAKKYYDNIIPTLDRMIGSKYDEVYTPAGTTQQCKGNSCLSFANSAQEQALGIAPRPRTRELLYNPAFAHDAENQGWYKVPLSEIQPGDRLQRWRDANATAATGGQQRQADLQGTEYYSNGQPTHTAIFGGFDNPNNDPTMRGVGARAIFYQDGKENEPAGRDTRILGPDYVAYRYRGQPTAQPAAQVPLVVTRAEGGKITLQPRTSTVAESTGVVRAKRLAPILQISDVRDPGARAFLQQNSYSDNKHFYHNKLLLDQYLRNGSPRIQQSDTVKRASYRGKTNTMFIAPGNTSDYLAELSHAQQLKTMGATAYKKAAVEGRKLEDSDDPIRGRYGVPGQLEHDAHSIIQPQLTQESDDIGRRGYQMQHELEQRLAGQQATSVQFGLRKQLSMAVRRAAGGVITLQPRKLREGGSIIADGSLHSEKHGIEGEGLGRTGIPVVFTDTGERAAEIERNELILGDRATASLEKLLERHAGGDKLAAHMAGKLLQAELRDNTIPNARYEKRLGLKPHVRTADQGAIAVVGRDGQRTHHFNGTNRVVSQAHTRELVSRALKATGKGHLRNLGLRAFSIIKGQDKSPVQYAKS